MMIMMMIKIMIKMVMMIMMMIREKFIFRKNSQIHLYHL